MNLPIIYLFQIKLNDSQLRNLHDENLIRINDQNLVVEIWYKSLILVKLYQMDPSVCQAPHLMLLYPIKIEA